MPGQDVAHVVLYGNPVDGIKIVGPFADHEEAMDFGDNELKNLDWWITPIQSPKAWQVTT